MFNLILWIISLTALVMCIKLFRWLKAIEGRMNSLDSSLTRLRQAKPASAKSTSVAASPATKKAQPQSVSKPKILTVKTHPQKQPSRSQTPVLLQQATQTPPTITSKPDSEAFPEILTKIKVAASSPKPVKPKSKPSEFAPQDSPQEVSMEQVIGTRWIPIAGILLIICGVAFFLKYAYDNFNISPLTRILVVAASGLVAIVVGEITRRRGYEIVAKSVTSLGIALLYAAVFVASTGYNIISPWPAFALAIAITIAAMLYAVMLDEIIIAFLSLLGGYITPVIISSGQNLPIPLFTYLFVLSIGAMLCAYYRKWRPVNFLAFAGTFGLYTLWFMDSYGRGVIVSGTNPIEMPIALTGLTAFFAVFLIMPVLYELVRKTKASKEDVLLILINSAVTFFYLYVILNSDHRLALAFAAITLSAVHLALMAIFDLRSSEDSDLCAIFLAIGIVFFTVSLSLFFKAGVLSFAWAAQGAVLALIGVRYKSLMIRLFGLVALALSCGNLLLWLPTQSGNFQFIFNPAFGVWCCVAVAACVNHLVYRFASEKEGDLYSIISQVLYVLMTVLLIAVSAMEWFYHCKFNLLDSSDYMVLKALPVIFAIALTLFVVRPLYPAGKIRQAFAGVLATAGIICTVVSLVWLHGEPFTIIANSEFLSVIVFPVALATYHILYRFVYTGVSESEKVITCQLYSITGILAMLIASGEWFFRCSLNQADMMPAVLIGQTVIFAVSIPFFIIRPLSPLDKTSRTVSVIVTVIASVYTVIASVMFYESTFRIFLNTPFFVGIAFAATLAVSSALLYYKDSRGENYPELAAFFGLSFVVVLLALLTEQIFMYWYCLNKYEVTMENWIFRAYMYISILWALYAAALMIVGFWRRIPVLRYVALGLFGLLLVKVFLVDTSQVQNIYRIGAFLATGGVLVAVSYLYQFLKKKNFFENLTAHAIIAEEE